MFDQLKHSVRYAFVMFVIDYDLNQFMFFFWFSSFGNQRTVFMIPLKIRVSHKYLQKSAPK